MQKNVTFWSYFFVRFHLPSLLLPSPLSSTYHLSFPKEVNKKLSDRGQNALKKHTNAITTTNIILYLSVRQSRLAGRIMFSTCPFVHSSVRLFVLSSVTNL